MTRLFLLNELAMKYAASLGAEILAHKINGDSITFVLSTGPKLTMTKDELAAQENTAPAPSTGGVPPASTETPQAAKSKRKAKSK